MAIPYHNMLLPTAPQSRIETLRARRAFLVFCAALLLALAPQSRAQTAPTSLLFTYSNQSGNFTDDQIFLTFEVPSANIGTFSASYAGGAISINSSTTLSSSIPLSAIGSGGVTISNMNGGQIYVSYGAPLADAPPPNPSAPADPNYLTPYMYMEMTYLAAGGNQADITAINYYSAPLQLQTYSSGTLVQSKGFTGSTTISSQLAAITGNSPSAVITQPGTSTPLRVLGPTNYPSPDSNNNYQIGPYPTFDAYLDSVRTANQTTTFANTFAYNPGGSSQPNYSFSYNLQATVALDANNNDQITLSGTISVTTTPSGGSPGTPVVYNIGITSPVDGTGNLGLTSNELSSLLYSGVATANTVFTGSWSDLDGIVSGSTALAQSEIIGELSEGFSSGYVGSTQPDPNNGNTPYGNEPSNMWWANTNPYTGPQPTSPFYNQYAAIISANSNTVYGSPYADRFSNLSPDVDIYTHDNGGTNVYIDTLELVIQPTPLAPVPEPSVCAMLAAGACGLLMFRRKKAA